jgi:ribonuclease BN (tRNA processing enzyme)
MGPMSTIEDEDQIEGPQDDGKGVTRRSLLGTAAVGSAGALLATASPAAAGIRSGKGSPRHPTLPVGESQPEGPCVSLLGTSGGPPPDYVRAGISSALTIEGQNYVVDAGRSSVTQYLNAGLTFTNLEAIFIGALHADHIADYYNYFMLASMENSERDQLRNEPLTVFGPGPAGALPPPEEEPEEPPLVTIAPASPTPGIVELTTKLTEGYAYSSNIFIREQNVHPITNFTAGVQAIPVPNVGADPLTNRAPEMEPFKVYEDERVKVTATLVPLGLVFPAFAFRFDSEYGSVTFSQDNRPSKNLIRLAKGSDMLVHEAIDYLFYKRHRASKLLLKHLRKAHTFIDEVGPIAEAAEVGTLVLTHLSPSNPIQFSDGRYLRKAKVGFGGKVIVGNDLDRIPLRAGSNRRSGGGAVPGGRTPLRN